jgi:hypothetical protein
VSGDGEDETERAEAVSAAHRFRLEAEPDGLRALSSGPEAGNIHQSWVVTCSAPARRYLLQRINTAVFPDPDALMANVVTVTEHVRQRLAAEGGDVERGVVSLVATTAGGWLWPGASGPWRCFRFVEDSYSRATAVTAGQSYGVGQAFGRFQRLLLDLDPGALGVTIPGFHDPARRLAALERAVADDPAARAAEAAAEVEAVLAHRRLLERAERVERRGQLRITHNDCKVSNVLFDGRGTGALCVVDLDTVMAGRLAWDFGDMVRSATCPVGEDEVDLSRVVCDVDAFGALWRGYMSEAGGFVDEAERELLGGAGALVTFEQAARFLADHLEGDSYYRVRRPNHNLDRARTQLRLLESILDHEHELTSIVGGGP